MGRNSTLFVIFLAAPLAARADQVTFTPIKDNTLYEDATGGLSDGAGPTFFAGRTAQSANSRRRGLLAFDLSAIPPRSTVLSVTLALSMVKTSATAKQVGLHRITADWGEGTSNAGATQGGDGTAATPLDATWLHRFHSPAQPWTSPGGDFAAAASAVTSVGAIGAYSWGSSAPLVADVQGWVDHPESNFGWALVGDETSSRTAKEFSSRESASAGNRPLLTVQFTLPPPPRVPALSPAGLVLLGIGLVLSSGFLLLRGPRNSPAR